MQKESKVVFMGKEYKVLEIISNGNCTIREVDGQQVRVLKSNELKEV